MSSLLYRLGRWCADHAWRTITIWLVVLVGVGVLAGTVGKPLTSQISIPGTTFEKVLDGLGARSPRPPVVPGPWCSRAATQPFTDEQRAAVEDVFASWAELPHVKRVNNPFEAQAELDESAADIAAAAATIEDGQARARRGPCRRSARASCSSPAARRCSTSSSPRTPTTRRSPPCASRSSRAVPSSRQGRAELEQGEADLTAGRAQYEDGKAVADATVGHPPRERGRPARRRPGAVRRQRPVRAGRRPGADPRARRHRPRRRRRHRALQRRDHPGHLAHRPRRGHRPDRRARRARRRRSAASSPPACRCSSRCSASAWAWRVPWPSRCSPTSTR